MQNLQDSNYLALVGRLKNGLNFQIWVGAGLILFSCIPLVAAFALPIMSLSSLMMFALGTGAACIGWPLHVAALEKKQLLLRDMRLRGYSDEDVERAAVSVMPRAGQMVFAR